MPDQALVLAPVPCTRCKEKRVKCDRTLVGCGRCRRSASECKYRKTGLANGLVLSEAVSVAPSAATVASHGDARLRLAVACVRCRDVRRKCDAVRPHCGLCARKGIPCEYVAHHSPKSMGSSDSSVSSGSPVSGSETMAKDSPSIDQPTLELADTRQMPTIQDCMLVYQYVSNTFAAVDVISLYLVDMPEFLRTFTFQPTSLRLAYCAIAAVSLRSPQKQELFDRATYAIVKDARKELHTPSHPSLLIHSHF
ncbi:hypothetical protein BC830DRAFT_934016 [Chytriomyces sp. MP71]|nr:hypothetical protein BC830DRAFT_934016 [Chytriomyces sp. MP71]